MTFAELEDVQDRLGRDLTAAETTQVGRLLESAAELVLDAVGKTEEWAAEQETLPTAFKTVSVEVVNRVIANPTGARSESETLGQHQYSVSFKDGQNALELTDSEVTRLRRAVYGRTSGSARARSILDDLPCGIWPPLL